MPKKTARIKHNETAILFCSLCLIVLSFAVANKSFSQTLATGKNPMALHLDPLYQTALTAYQEKQNGTNVDLSREESQRIETLWLNLHSFLKKNTIALKQLQVKLSGKPGVVEQTSIEQVITLALERERYLFRFLQEIEDLSPPTTHMAPKKEQPVTEKPLPRTTTRSMDIDITISTDDPQQDILE